jgi:hypothetical protein
LTLDVGTLDVGTLDVGTVDVGTLDAGMVDVRRETSGRGGISLTIIPDYLLADQNLTAHPLIVSAARMSVTSDQSPIRASIEMPPSTGTNCAFATSVLSKTIEVA